MAFNSQSLLINPAAEADRIGDAIRRYLTDDLRRRGLVVGLSGGIDSSVTAALAVRALGKNRVFGVLMPERESSPDTLQLSSLIADFLGVERAEEDITTLLEAARFYQRYEEAVRTVIPGFSSKWKSKLVTSGVRDKAGFTFFTLVAQSPDGAILRERLPLKAYLEIVAATNFKQRTRKMIEYYHADRLNFAVAGTPNRLEYDQGFFVKNGDGSADIKPIAHLFKCQVYQLADYLELPETIRRRPPTTDTYSLPQGQDEFYFSVPVAQLDFCLYGKNHGIDAESVGRVAGLSSDIVQAVWKDIDRKRATTRPLHLPPLLVEPVSEILSHP
ncbi:MAG TPA: NAD(+) synthase [Verrucomicrobiota bacterium]|nr:NAD(+) synthase [Verrucomicrobiales bacterium]HRI13909.1 NAD(+) synthase [Verrucomicrobiota bacterium]